MITEIFWRTFWRAFWRHYLTPYKTPAINLKPHPWFYRLFMNRKFDVYLLWPLNQYLILWLVTHANAHGFMVFGVKWKFWHGHTVKLSVACTACGAHIPQNFVFLLLAFGILELACHQCLVCLIDGKASLKSIKYLNFRFLF